MHGSSRPPCAGFSLGAEFPNVPHIGDFRYGNDMTQRTQAFRLKLSPEMSERLSVLAKNYGMPDSTLAAFALAEFVNRQELQERAMKMAILDMSRRATDLDEEKLEAAFKVAMPAIVASLSDSEIAKLRLDYKADAEGDAS